MTADESGARGRESARGLVTPDLVDESPAARASRALNRAQEALADAHRSLDDAERYMRTSIWWASAAIVAVVADVVLRATGVI